MTTSNYSDDFFPSHAEAIERVLRSLSQDAAATLNRVRALPNFDREFGSVFIVLALCAEMLERMEHARDDFAGDFVALRDDVMNLETTLRQYRTAQSTAMQHDVRAAKDAIVLTAEAVRDAAQSVETTISQALLTSVTSLAGILDNAAGTLELSRAEIATGTGEVTVAVDAVHAAVVEVQTATSAMAKIRTAATELDPNLRSSIAESVKDAVVNELEPQLQLGSFLLRFWYAALVSSSIGVVVGVGITLLVQSVMHVR